MNSFFNQLFAFLFALVFASSVLAAPVAIDASAPSAQLEKRVTHTGQGTYFYPGMGACGWNNDSGDAIIAISKKIWNGGHNCGQYMQISSEGKSMYAKVVDECPECSSGSLDMSPAVFKHFASESKGVIKVSWHFMAKGWKP